MTSQLTLQEKPSAMEALLQQIRDGLVSTQDTVCLQRARLVTEAYQRYENDLVPVKRAKAFAHVLRNMDLDVQSNPFFAGNTSSRPRAWMLAPEFGLVVGDAQVVIENPCLKGFLDGKIPADLQQFWAGRSFGGPCGIGHLAVDLQRVVHEGLEALIAETQGFAHEPDPTKRAYREAMAIALQAVIDWARRYADAAESAARTAQDPVVREAHCRVAAACRRVPAKPARNLFEGLQAIVLVHLATVIEGHGMSVSIGLPDRVLAPFITDDFDPEFATNLIAAFRLKLTANSLFGRASKTQSITVGGVNHCGEDQCNALTLCFLDACDRVRVGDPHLFLRWHENISPAVKQRAVELLAEGLSMPLLVHDVPTAQGFINASVLPEDAWEYCIIGCSELGIPGRSAESATSRHGLVQHLAFLNQTLLEHPDPDAIQDMPQLLACIEGRMRRQLSEARQRGEQHKRRAAECVPTPFTSALMRGCIRRGQDMLVGMDYHFPALYERGLTNAANALAAIQKFVFEEKTFTMTELIQAMQDNFRDERRDSGVRAASNGARTPLSLKRVRSLLLTAPKWGNDDERADGWALELVAMRERVLDEIDRQFGHPPHFVCHVVRSLHHVDGKHIAASPDGRFAWTPVADSIGAQTGTAHNGPVGILQSVLKLDAARYYRGGYNLNLTLLKWGATPAIVRSLIEGFFDEGGQELQINCFDAATLRAAQRDPESYRDLMVRVAGFSARFVDLPPVEQEELIQRALAKKL